MIFDALLREEAAVKPATKVIRFNLRRALSMAASVTILIIAGVFYFSNRSISPENLYARYMEQPNLTFDGGVATGQESGRSGYDYCPHKSGGQLL